MSELRELYQEFILDHGKNPRNFRVLEGANRTADGYNPLCGDRITVSLIVDDDGTVKDVAFQGTGCAISTASASTMTQVVKGKSRAEVDELFEHFRALVTGEGDLEPDEDLLGKLAVFGGVQEFPMRVKCATLAWHTVHEALAGEGGTITTE